ncbi:MAG: HEPN domain-containing protein [Elusimicrobia bacterium]|nr:HEPN domain-containing protein [Elusimicrobiota bacterium]
MTFGQLGASYIKKASSRFEILEVLFEKGDYSDVVRETQEMVELALKGILRLVGIEPPKIHDVGEMLLEHSDKFKDIAGKSDLKKAAKISKMLRRERELAFYGDIDFIPTEEYTAKDARSFIKDGEFVLKLARKVLEKFGK